MLSAIKILSIFIAALAGVIGSLINFKSTDGKITNWGIFCVTLIILSSLLSGGIQLSEDAKSEQNTLSQIRANSETLARIDRSLLHFDKIGVYALVAPDWSVAPFDDLMMDIKSQWETSRMSALENSTGLDENVRRALSSALSSGISGFGNTTYASDRELSDLFMNTLCKANIKINIYKGLRVENVSQIRVGRNNGLLGSDLSITVRNPCAYDYDFSRLELGESLSRRPFDVEYGAKNGEYVHLSHPIAVEISSNEPNNWRGNGSVLSITDILNSTIMFELDHPGQSMVGTGVELRNLVGIRYLHLSFSNGILLQFSGENLNPVELPNGNIGYLFHVDEDFDSLLQSAEIDKLNIIYPD